MFRLSKLPKHVPIGRYPSPATYTDCKLERGDGSLPICRYVRQTKQVAPRKVRAVDSGVSGSELEQTSKGHIRPATTSLPDAAIWRFLTLAAWVGMIASPGQTAWIPSSAILWLSQQLRRIHLIFLRNYALTDTTRECHMAAQLALLKYTGYVLQARESESQKLGQKGMSSTVQKD